MKHPMQKQVTDKTGVVRFVENKLVTWLIAQLPDDMNSLAIEFYNNDRYDDDDYDQILQQIGYSVSGIPYRDEDKYNITDHNIDSEEYHEKAYKDLKNQLRPIMSDLYGIAEEDM